MSCDKNENGNVTGKRMGMWLGSGLEWNPVWLLLTGHSPGWYWDGGQLSKWCSWQTQCGWSSGWGHPFPGQRRLWLHLVPGSWTCATGHGQGRPTDAGQHCSRKGRNRVILFSGGKYTSCVCIERTSTPTGTHTRTHLKFSPPSAMGYSSFSVNPETKLLRWALSRACHTSSSEYDSKGSRFTRSVPEKRTGSCSWGGSVQCAATLSRFPQRVCNNKHV